MEHSKLISGMIAKFKIAYPYYFKDLKNEDINNMISQIKELDGIDFVLSFRELSSVGITEDIIPSDLSNIFESENYEMISRQLVLVIIVL